MASDSVFRRLPDEGRRKLAFTFDGESLEACEGDSVAAALLAAGRVCTRLSAISGSARGPYCLMGVCFECLVEIDGTQNLQGCMVEVAEGMSIRSMQGARSLDATAERDHG